MSDTEQLFALIASSIDASKSQVQAAVTMLDAGDTVPFISRYRKEATGGLTDTQLRDLEKQLAYQREFNARRETILAAIQEQGAMTPALREKLLKADTKAALEDLYLPFKKKRRTKGQLAIAAGLEPLADALWNSPEIVPEELASQYVSVDRAVPDEKAALEGARAILVERFAEDAELVGRLREQLQTQAYLCASAAPKKDGVTPEDIAKFKDYIDHQEPLAKIPSHRALALFRGRAAGVLSLKLQLRESHGFGDQGLIDTVARHLGFRDRASLPTPGGLASSTGCGRSNCRFISSRSCLQNSSSEPMTMPSVYSHRTFRTCYCPHPRVPSQHWG